MEERPWTFLGHLETLADPTLDATKERERLGVKDELFRLHVETGEAMERYREARRRSFAVDLP